MANHRSTLLQLTYIRTLTIFGQSAMLWFIVYGLHAEINLWMVVSVLAALTLLNAVTFARLHSPWPVTEAEFFTQLVADIVLYGCMLYQLGGATNPFISLLLIPMIIAAATLGQLFSWLVASLVIVIYSSLLVYHIPVFNLTTQHQHSALALFDLHVTGMWLNFLLTVLMVTYFIVQMRRAMQQQQEHLEIEREKRIHDQQLLSLATMAAGTAHELGTPLSTMRVVLHELELEYQNKPELLEDLQLLQQQVDLCADRLQHLSRTVKDEQESHSQLPVTQLMDEVLDQWQLLRPSASYQFSKSAEQAPLIRATTSLRQALINLLNNAADASPEAVEISLIWNDQQISIQLHDHGAGLSLEQQHNLGKPFITTKGRGLGIGLFLTATTLARYDGTVQLYNHPDGGTITDVLIPRSDNNVPF